VTFNSIDVSCLLAKIDKLSTEMTALKQGMNIQASASADRGGAVRGTWVKLQFHGHCRATIGTLKG